MRIGTRGSALALWQARTVARLITETGGPSTEIVVIRTSGDERPAAPLAPATDIGPPDAPQPSASEPIKRMFVKEIEDALLDERIDLAVHSSKDLPAVLPDGLRIAAALTREDPRDAMILPGQEKPRDWAALVSHLGRGTRIGTSSVRRAAVLASIFPDATFTAVRGNVDTRLRKLDAGDCDVLVLAAAGLKRLGLEPRISALIPGDLCIPAPGQGIVSVEIADTASSEIKRAVARLDDPDASAALHAERAVVEALGGGCQLPLGVLATIDGSDMQIAGLVASLDGRRVVRASLRGNRGHAAALGSRLAAQLLAAGAGESLERSRGA
jgi:hydroxymethylbilane synthase